MNVEFVDTNNLLYAHDADMGIKQARAIELLPRLAESGAGAISIQVLIEFYSAATRKFGMPSAEARQIIQDLKSWMLIHQPVVADVLRAVDLHSRYKTSWFDALILNSAMQLECSTLWSEDFGDGHRYGDLIVRNPFK